MAAVEPGCHVRLTHSSVSPTHAQLRRQSRGWAVFDLRSAGGTFVGDERVEGPHPLRDGDVLRFGQQVLRFRDPREPR